MLAQFIAIHRDDLIARAREKVMRRLGPQATAQEVASSVPLFLDQLASRLLAAPGLTAEIRLPDAANQSAAVHGADLLSHGYSVAQVVHDYADICGVIAELGEELDVRISNHQLHVLNACLDASIADAVTEYARLRDQSTAANETERMGAFAHELRNKLAAAEMGFRVLQSGRSPLGGSVAAMVGRNFQGMARLIEHALAEVRVESGNIRIQPVSLRRQIAEAEVDGKLAASARKIPLSVSAPETDVTVDADAEIVAGAIANLLQNAFKFTRPGGSVSLKTRREGDRVALDIRDGCGGLPAGTAERLFGAFEQTGENRSGLGLGLFISQRGVRASGGEIHVRDLPGSGCIFTIDLPLSAHAAL